jgi:hypothetical protein
MGREVESPSGIGELYEGETKLGTARYSITVYQDTHFIQTFGSGSQEIDGLGRITGVIEPEPPLSALEFVLRNAELSLKLEDGRWWDFLFTNDSGDAVNRGPRTPTQ